MQTTPPKWGHLPVELRNCPQWLLANKDSKGDLKVPCSVDRNGHLSAGSVINKATWLTFDVACGAAAHYGLGIGFVLSKDDPFSCIDLDVKNASNESDPNKWTPAEAVARHGLIVQTFNSYTERSQSGQGLHVWVTGTVGAGSRKDWVEVYSQERFIVCTGDAVHNVPIVERGELLFQLVSEMKTSRDSGVQLEEIEETLDDGEIAEKLGCAANADKFMELYEGDWRALGYPSQSEADLALMSMYTFYSKSNEQCRRLFRMSGLGKREKAVKNDVYLNRTLGIIRGRQERETAAERSGEDLANQLLARFNETKPTLTVKPVTEAIPELDWPPGFVGVIARFIYHNAPRPVKEVAIVAAFGLAAGICGKAYNIPQSGLNLYMVLVARSAIGKEAMHSGISNIIHQCVRSSIHASAINDFVDYTNYASGPALSKAVAGKQSFVNISGEWGRKLKRLSHEDGRDQAMSSLRTVMTDLYQKSGARSVVGGMAYSNKENSVASVNGVAYSMIGETTPQTFYESLTESMMEDGFLSRFIVVEYDGDRPAANENIQTDMGTDEINHLTYIIQMAVSTISSMNVIYVGLSPEASPLLNSFDKECDIQINSTKDEGWRQMWNRAHLKVCRLSGCMAAMDNPCTPVIQPIHVQYALYMIRRDIATMSTKIKSGDVGTSDLTRERKLLSVVSEYLTVPVPRSYGTPDELRLKGIIPRKYIQTRVQSAPVFAQHKLGATKALSETINNVIDSGYLVEVSKDKLVADFGFHGKAYRIVNLPTELTD